MNTLSKFVLVSYMVASTCAMQAAFAGGTNPNLSQGIAAYNNRDYAFAAQKLESALAQSPSNPSAHYYLALSYQALHRIEDAKREYRWNYEHKKDKNLAYQSWQGLMGLERAGGSSSRAAHTTAASVIPSNLDNAPPDHPPTAGTPVAVKSTPVKFDFQFKAGCPRHGGGM